MGFEGSPDMTANTTGKEKSYIFDVICMYYDELGTLWVKWT